MTRSRPTDPALDAELARGVALHRAGRPGEAEQIYRGVLLSAPRHAFAQNYLGTLLASTGRLDEGIEHLRRSTKDAPAVPEFHLNLADALIAAGRSDAAEASIRRALQQGPHAQAFAKLGLLLQQQGKMQPAAYQLERALKLDPTLIHARHNLGVLRAQLGEMSAAQALLRGVHVLAPSFVDALNALALIEQRSGAVGDAATRLRRVIGMAPDFTSARTNLATVLDQQGHRFEAARHLRQALSVSPSEASAWSNLANLGQDRGRPSTAERLLRRALAVRINDAGIWSNLGRAFNAQGRTADAIRCYRQALGLEPAQVGARSNLLFALSYANETTNEQLFAEVCGTLKGFALQARERPPRRRGTGRLKIAVASADLRGHPVGRNVLGIFEHHRDVELHVYGDGAAHDHEAALFRRHADGWRSATGLTDAALAEQMRRDGMDALVILASNTAGNRPLLAAFRGAPVQISFHDLMTSGLSAMDWWISDPVLHHEATTERFVERLWRLPTFYLHRPPADSPDVAPPPSGDRGFITFGSCNHPAKLTPHVAEVWAGIMAAVPGSRLLLKYRDAYGDDALRDRYRRLFLAHGIGPDRLDFRFADLARRDQLSLLAEIDIALDPFPFNGSTTTFEALWMGVPIVTLAGERFLGRVGASVLTALNLQELIASDEAGYVAIAAGLAEDRHRLALLRQTLRSRVLGSPLCDAPSYTRTIEAAFIAMAG